MVDTPATPDSTSNTTPPTNNGLSGNAQQRVDAILGEYVNRVRNAGAMSFQDETRTFERVTAIVVEDMDRADGYRDGRIHKSDLERRLNQSMSAFQARSGSNSPFPWETQNAMLAKLPDVISADQLLHTINDWHARHPGEARTWDRNKDGKIDNREDPQLVRHTQDLIDRVKQSPLQVMEAGLRELGEHPSPSTPGAASGRRQGRG